MKILNDPELFKKYSWRPQVSSCPHCKREPKGEYPSLVWMDPAWVVYVVTHPRLGPWKPGSFIYFSQCPTCKKISWNHHDLEEMRGWPEDINEALLAEARTRLHVAMLDWKTSPCSSCSAIQSLNLQYMYFARHCDAGSGGPIAADEECKKFKRLKRPARR